MKVSVKGECVGNAVQQIVGADRRGLSVGRRGYLWRLNFVVISADPKVLERSPVTGCESQVRS